MVVRVGQAITEASGGRLVVETFPGGTIVPSGEELSAIDRGAFDAMITGHSYNMSLFPTAGILETTSGGLTGVQRILWWVNGGGDELAVEMYETLNVKYINSSVMPPEIWCQSKEPLRSVADTKGLKMRAIGTGAIILDKMGISTVSIAGGEVYESIQRGVIDAFEFSGPASNWKMAFYEVAPYLYMSASRAPTASHMFAVNIDSWNELTPDLQNIVIKVARADVPKWFAENIVFDYEYLQMFVDYGTNVEKLPADIDEALMKAADEFYNEQAAGDPMFAKVLESQRQFKELCEFQGIR